MRSDLHTGAMLMRSYLHVDSAPIISHLHVDAALMSYVLHEGRGKKALKAVCKTIFHPLSKSTYADCLGSWNSMINESMSQ